MLADHPDQQMVSFILNAIKYGVRIGHHGFVQSILSKNWPSSILHFEKVSQLIYENLRKGRVAGPFDHPPLEHFISSPLGAIPKKNSNKIRIIHDLSYPPGQSVNDGIDSDEYTLSYITLDRVAEIVDSFPEPCYLSKIDLANAFTHVIVHPNDWNKLGFSWDGRYYISTCLPFGLRSSPKIFDTFAQGLEYMAIKNGCHPLTSHYLDDSLLPSKDFQDGVKHKAIFKKTAKDSGWDTQDDKEEGPAQEIEYTGIVVNTVKRQFTISEDRMSEIIADLQSWLGKKVCTKRQLLSIIGKLSFASKVIRSARTFLRRLIELSKKVKYLHYKIKLNSEARKDLMWWLESIQSHNGVALFPTPWIAAETLHLWTDASNVAAGAVYEKHWFCVPFIGDKKWITNMTICWRELYIVVKSVMTWGHKLANMRVTLNVDNQAVCYCINSGTSKNPELMELIRSLYFILCQYNIEVHAIYIPTYDNVCADALSRLDFIRFRESHPEAYKIMYFPADIKYLDLLI